MGGARPHYMPRRGGRGGGFPLIAGIVVLALLGLVLWLFLRSGGTGGSTESAPSNNGAATSSAKVESNGTDLLGLAADGTSSDFEPYENQPVHASNVPVVSTVGDGVFWIGTSSENRLLVVSAGSAPSVNPGDVVSIDGTLRVLPVDFATRYGVSDSMDQADLQRTGHYVAADRIDTGQS
ncbi:MAG: hypothetical protein ACJ758_09085 [Actinomycetota bacterium]|jgi:hypothetical protein